MPEEVPLVSVIIATYNWSSVLRYAIQSVLWQTHQNFEVLIVGDGCTDDSAEVVASFRDSRLRWHNLPENSGSQSMPNNKGLELARGSYIAYLGHDDVWHPRHLETLVTAITAQKADVAYAITILMSPPNVQWARGISPKGVYEYPAFFPPSSMMHRRGMIDEIGAWKDYRSADLPPDAELVYRARRHGKHFVPTNELTVFKFPSGTRLNSYVEKPSHEQADYIRRIQTEPDFLYHELKKLVLYIAPAPLPLLPRIYVLREAKPGELVEKWRAQRGLSPKPLLDDVPKRPPLWEDIQMLQLLGRAADINSPEDRKHLYQKRELPTDGLFPGYSWYDIQFDLDYMLCRPVKNHAQIVITRPSGAHRHLAIEVAPGRALNFQPFELQLLDSQNRVIGAAWVEARRQVEFELPLAPGQGAIFRLHIDEPPQNREVESYTDHFQVYKLFWLDDETLKSRQQLSDLQNELNAKNALIDELLFYRKTSMRYYARLWRLRLRKYIPWI